MVVATFPVAHVDASSSGGYPSLSLMASFILLDCDACVVQFPSSFHTSHGAAFQLSVLNRHEVSMSGKLPESTNGARSEHVQRYQDVNCQDKIVGPYSRYSGRLEAGQDVKPTVQRALLMATGLVFSTEQADQIFLSNDGAR